MEKSYFDKPTQVVFADSDNPGEWNNIADEIVGGEFSETLDRNEDGEIYEVSDEDYEQHSFLLEEEEETAVFANAWVDGVAMPSID